MADIVTSQLDWDGNRCYAFWELAPCCGQPDLLGGAKCCVWWWCCSCFAACQLWGTALGFDRCAVVNHCLIPFGVGCLFGLLWICLNKTSTCWIPYWMMHIATAPTVRYNIRQKKGIPAAGPCNGWLGDCLCHTCGVMCCCLPVCQELRAVQVDEWDCLVWLDKAPELIEKPVNVQTVWFNGGLPCKKDGGGSAATSGQKHAHAQQQPQPGYHEGDTNPIQLHFGSPAGSSPRQQYPQAQYGQSQVQYGQPQVHVQPGYGYGHGQGY